MKLICAAFAATLMTAVSLSRAGPGHDHGEGAFAEDSGVFRPFTLSKDVIGDLNIRSKPAEKRMIAQAVSMPFLIVPIADRTIEVYPSFSSGQVRKLLVTPGQQVQKNHPLVRASVLSGLSQDATIHAPIAGKISALGITPGQRITDGTFIATISNPGGVMAKGELPEGFAANLIKPGDEVSLLVDTHDPKYIKGRVLHVDQTLHPDTRTYAVYVSLDDEDHTALLRHTGQMTVWAQKTEEAVSVVPRSAIFGERGGEFVFIHHDCGTFERHPVKTGRKNGLFVEVDGLHPREKVVFSGGYLLQFVRGEMPDHDHAHGLSDDTHEDEESDHVH